MPHPLDDVVCACLPIGFLPRLAPLRCVPGVQVAQVNDRLWVRWEPGADVVLRCVLPCSGGELFAFRDGHWQRWEQRLPCFDFPRDLEYRPLFQVLFPAPIQPLPIPEKTPPPLALTLVPDDHPRPTTALLGPLEAFTAWAATLPGPALTPFHGLLFGDRLLVMGKKLPLLPESERFWGRSILVPIGFRLEPDLAESDLRTSAGVSADEMLLVQADRTEILRGDDWTPLSLAGLRLALLESLA